MHLTIYGRCICGKIDSINLGFPPLHRYLEYEQLQLALAMSASLNGEGEAPGSGEPPTLAPTKGRRKRARFVKMTPRGCLILHHSLQGERH